MIYKICDLYVKMDARGQRLLKQAQAYLLEDRKDYDFKIDLQAKKVQELIEKQADLPYDELEYIYAGFLFNNELLNYQGFFLHASAVAVDDKAYLFSAPSGTGKSTHSQLWLDYLGDRAMIINDDKPSIRFIDGKFYVYGSPFSGKSDLNVNVRAELGAIAVLNRGQKNEIRQIESQEAIFPILNQTIRPKAPKKMDRLLNLLDVCLKETPLYELSCNMDIEAAKLAYEKMRRK